ncbi:outer membrane protein [Kumtagia ephedrae]|jgi:outer membrane immunogenic protein|uniref:Porin family protein n=1 Tax=Kumtagia ephedrae TaxID=2116701 RepID=A0A2P7SEW4_9HYPH|nr:outer membrane protein [Mesorhizobium ephedrae]PSJ61039.1 porin family protein [Mesorhizobium ephedrae]
MSASIKFARPVAAALGLAALVGIGAANAADVIEEAPQPAVPMEVAPVASWSGAYAGVTAGYGFAGRSHDDTNNNKIDTDGFVGGAFLGYQVDTGSGIVAGVEGDVGYSGVEGSNAGTEVKGGVDGSLRARLGYTLTPDVLGYVTAGGAAKRMSVEEGGEKDSQTQLGWTAGVGTDVKITEKVFGRVEYRYTDYGSEDFSTGTGSGKVDAKDHRVQVGLGLQF